MSLFDHNLCEIDLCHLYKQKLLSTASDELVDFLFLEAGCNWQRFRGIGMPAYIPTFAVCGITTALSPFTRVSKAAQGRALITVKRRISREARADYLHMCSMYEIYDVKAVPLWRRLCQPRGLGPGSTRPITRGTHSNLTLSR